MRCPICQWMNRDGTPFCEKCGAGLAIVCGACGASNPGKGNFCSTCGSALVKVAAPDALPPRDSAERRQLTIVFCDLVGFTALSARLDPEDLRKLVRAYQAAVSAQVRRYEGAVAKLSGDGVMAFFGFPKAHEDDAERAVLASLDAIDAVRALRAYADDDQADRLAARVGIATGEVVVGDLEGEGVSEQWSVIGETPNLAARLQAIAEPNSVVIAARTKSMTRGRFRYVSLGMRNLKGIPSPVEVWSVTGKRAAASRFDALHGESLTPMVGRKHEIEQIRDCWRRASVGNGQVVLVRGDPGIGKSRLVQFFVESLSDEPHRRVQLQCSPYHSNSALHPVIAYIQQAAKLAAANNSEQKCERLAAFFQIPDAERATKLPLVASLLSISCAAFPQAMLEPARQREQTFALLLEQLRALAQKTPVVCVVEDVHWVDPSTLDLLQTVASSLRDFALLLIVTSRSEFAAPCKAHEILIERFDDDQVKQIVASVAAHHALPDEVVSKIVARADGVPLFAEELTKTVLDSGIASDGIRLTELSKPFTSPAIPATLLDSLMARLDRLPQGKSVAQLASVIGRTFDYELLAAIAELPEPELARALHRLQEAQLIYERGPALAGTFEFKHALIQDAAYQSQLRSVRRTHHEKIARAIEQRFPAIAHAQPELVAYHYAEADCGERALNSWQAAGMKAIERSANVEAIRHFEKALALLPQVEKPDIRAQLELQLQLALGIALTAVEGYASPAVEAAYSRALMLCEQSGNDRQKFAALFGMWRIAITQPALDQARVLASQLIEHAEPLRVTEMVLTAHGTAGITRLFLGDLAHAEDSFRRVIELYDPIAHRALAISAGQDPGLACMMYSALGWWLRGEAPRAFDQYEKAVERARALDHAFTLAYTLHVAAIIEQCAGNLPKLAERAAELERLAADRHFSQLNASARVFLGYARSEQGGGDASVEAIARGIADYQASSGLNVPYFKAMLAGALAKRGDIEAALVTIDEAMTLADAVHLQWYGAELCRMKAELLSQRDPPPDRDIDALFARAVATARSQGAASFEKRARRSRESWRKRAADGLALRQTTK